MPYNRSFKQDLDGIQIFIATNGVHTDFVLPIRTAIQNWQDEFDQALFNGAWPYATHIAFGWGDRGFYLNTPHWEDLRFTTAFNAIFLPSSSAMHVTLSSTPNENRYTVELSITREEYGEIVSYIKSSFRRNENGQVIRINHPGYGDYDLFFESPKKFHAFRTCNVWTNTGLKRAGIRTSLWTPFDRPILYHLNNASGSS